MEKANKREILVKSKERKAKFGEVFTPEWLVKDMCDALGEEAWNNITKTFLEPSCGSGNFLVEILDRKLKRCKDEREGLKAVNSIFGVDILADNVQESRDRIKDKYLEYFPNASEMTLYLLAKILCERIVCDDFLNPQTEIVKSWGITANEEYMKVVLTFLQTTA